jgi:predicted ATPase/DNA-binding XRE family transcriptional regulator
MNARASFGQWLKQRRKSLDLTQAELAHRVGCATSTLQKVEASQRRPSAEFAARLAEVLGIPSDQCPALIEFARLDQRPPSLSPANLPAEVTPLIGRERDAAEVRRRLLRDDTRLVMLVGPPGIGKTRLVLRVAADIHDCFDDGVFFVPLASITSPELVPPTILQTLGLKESGRQSPLDHLSDYLSDKLLLLVLDNLEQVIAVAPMIAKLLAACPLLKILATSRVALRVRAERQFHVPPLSLPDPTHLPPLQELKQYPALALFVERAQAVQPDFSLTEANAATVAHLCHRLDGLPLAIELVAARVRLLSPAEILRRLGGRFLLQSNGLRDIDERQRTLHNAIEWSYNLLTGDEQMLFVRLAVFVGGWTLAAAESVCGNGASGLTTPVLDLLAWLVNKSLVVQREINGESRFTMLETIREYALECLARSGEEETIHRRHAAHYLRLAGAAEPELIGMQQATWLDRLEREYGNLRAALEWALDSSDVATAAQLCGSLWHFWAMRGHLDEGRRWLEHTLRLGTEGGAGLLPSVRAMLLNGEGSLAYYQGDHAAAQLLFEQGLALAQEAGDKWGMAFALDGLGAQATSRGDYDRASAFSEQSLTLSREIGDDWLSGITLINLGELARLCGDDARATRLYEESLALLRRVGDRLFVAIALGDLGQVAHDQRRYDQARAIHQESLELCRKLGSQRGIALCLEKLAGIAAERGQPERAARLLGAAEALRQASQAPMGAPDHADYERFVAAARAGLDERAFAATWAEGRAMTLEQAITCALATDDAR